MHDIGLIALHQALRQQHRDARQRGEAERVVTPILAARRVIWIAFARVEMRGIDDEQVEPCGLRRNDARLATEQIFEARHHDAPLQRTQYRGIAGDHCPYRHAVLCQRARQCARHVGKATSLDQRKYLGDDGQDVQRHFSRRSIIG